MRHIRFVFLLSTLIGTMVSFGAPQDQNCCKEQQNVDCKCNGCKCNDWKFLGMLRIGGSAFVVTSRTESFLDGKPKPYMDIPDDGTELEEITLDMKKVFVIKVKYRTNREI